MGGGARNTPTGIPGSAASIAAAAVRLQLEQKALRDAQAAQANLKRAQDRVASVVGNTHFEGPNANRINLGFAVFGKFLETTSDFVSTVCSDVRAQETRVQRAEFSLRFEQGDRSGLGGGASNDSSS